MSSGNLFDDVYNKDSAEAIERQKQEELDSLTKALNLDIRGYKDSPPKPEAKPVEKAKEKKEGKAGETVKKVRPERKEKSRDLNKRLHIAVSAEAYHLLKMASVERSEKEGKFVSMNVIVDELLLQLDKKNRKKRKAAEELFLTEKPAESEEDLPDNEENVLDDTAFVTE